MVSNKEYDLFVDSLVETACVNFNQTQQSKLLQEKLDKMAEDCETMFTPSERQFAAECFCLLKEVSGEREAYIYRQGMLNCIEILKHMGVLA